MTFRAVLTQQTNWGSLIANELSTPIRLAITTGAMVLFVIGRIALQR
jgi:hypothetical protein